MNKYRPLLVPIGFVLATLIMLQVPDATGQANDSLAAIGVPRFQTNLPVENGSISAANGNLHLMFPLGSYPQRGGPPVTVTLVYDSTIWPQIGCCLNVPANLPGWSMVISALPQGVNYNIGEVDCKGGTVKYVTYSQWTFTEPNGTVHAFNGNTVMSNQQSICGVVTDHPSMNAFAADLSGYHISITNYQNATVYAPDGTSFGLDTNGNSILTGSFCNDLMTQYSGCNVTSDTLGRNLFTTTKNGNVITFTALNAGGTTSTYTATLGTISVSTNFGSVGPYIWGDVNGSMNVIQSLSLPDGTSYQFGYDAGTTAGHYGQLTSITLPTMGQITYSYSNFLDSEFIPGYSTLRHITRGVSQRVTPDGTWNYTPAVILQCTSSFQSGCKQQMTVQKPAYNGRNDNEVYKFILYLRTGAFPYEVDYYQGAVSPSNLLLTQFQTWESSLLLSSTSSLQVPGGTINQTTQHCDDSTGSGNIASTWEWNFYTGAVLSDPSWTSTSCTRTATTAPDRTTTASFLNGSNYLAKNIVNRPLSVTVTNSSGSVVAQTNYSYDGSALVSGAVGSCPTVIGSKNHDDTNYGTGNTVRGNPTQIQRLIAGSNYVTASNTYDITGQIRTSTNANGNITTYCYADNFFTDVGDSSNPSGYTPPTPTNAYLTTISYPSVNSVTQIDHLGYYWGTGQKALSTDPNNQTIYFHFYDTLNRSTSARFPDSGWIYKVYPSNSETQVDVGTGISSSALSISCPTTGSACRHDQTLTDGLGRVAHQTLVSDPGGQTSVDTAYDSNGRVFSASNPHRPGSSPTDGTEYYAYDGLDRMILVTRADGSIGHTYYGATVGSNGGQNTQLCSGYGIGYPILGIDEAGFKRQTWRDGFGRLIETDEPNSSGTLSIPTCYSYDLSNNLTGVLQNGSRQRTFSYDSLSRLLCAANPEVQIAICPNPDNGSYTAGTIRYSYDANGNVISKIAPKPNQSSTSVTLTTTYQYDPLDRLTQKSYNDGTTPTVQYGYDAIAPTNCSPSLVMNYPIGRRTAMCDAAGSEAWSYDSRGRVAVVQRTTYGVTKSTSYSTTSHPYNYDGSIAQLVYPSGRTITYTTNSAGQTVSAVDSANSTNYATLASYTPNGALSTLLNGSNVLSTWYYNSRLQPCRIAVNSSGTAPNACVDSGHSGNVLDFIYGFNLGSSDNGNVASIANNQDNTRSQTFVYDPLNRISIAQTTSTFSTSPAHCWGESFVYDNQTGGGAWGNLTNINGASSAYNGCSQEGLSVSVNNMNHVLNNGNDTYYDAAGNMTTLPSGVSVTYNGENQIKTVNLIGYAYDGDGKRVEKISGGTVYKIYWYGLNDAPLVETDGSGNITDEFILFNGRRIARRLGP